jgi:hypothetical protein
MSFDLVRPCATCPFRTDRPPFGLRRERCTQIAGDLFKRNRTFICHETAHDSKYQHCAGALILHEKLGRPNWLIRLAATLGLFDRSRLHLEAPVVDTAADFVRLASGDPAPRNLRLRRRMEVRPARAVPLPPAATAVFGVDVAIVSDEQLGAAAAGSDAIEQ